MFGYFLLCVIICYCVSLGDLNDSLGMSGGLSSSARDPPLRLAEARKSGMLGGPIMSTENISRGGRRGARPGNCNMLSINEVEIPFHMRMSFTRN